MIVPAAAVEAATLFTLPMTAGTTVRKVFRFKTIIVPPRHAPPIAPAPPARVRETHAPMAVRAPVRAVKAAAVPRTVLAPPAPVRETHAPMAVQAPVRAVKAAAVPRIVPAPPAAVRETHDPMAVQARVRASRSV